MRLRHTVGHTIENISRLRSLLGNCRGASTAAAYRDRWLQWWSQADTQLRNLFIDGELAASLYVSAEKVHNMSLEALPFILLNREIDVWEQRLDQVMAELVALRPFIERPGRIVVPDTSAFLEGEYFTDLDWQGLIGAGAEPVRLVVPVIVIEELDEHKRGRDRQRERAVSVLRRLWELGGSEPDQVARIPGRAVTAEVLLDGAWHVRRPVNDNEIVVRALTIAEVTGRRVVLAAADFSMLYQAAAAGLRAVLVPRPGERTTESAGG